MCNRCTGPLTYTCLHTYRLSPSINARHPPLIQHVLKTLAGAQHEYPHHPRPQGTLDLPVNLNGSLEGCTYGLFSFSSKKGWEPSYTRTRKLKKGKRMRHTHVTVTGVRVYSDIETSRPRTTRQSCSPCSAPIGAKSSSRHQ